MGAPSRGAVVALSQVRVLYLASRISHSGNCEGLRSPWVSSSEVRVLLSAYVGVARVDVRWAHDPELRGSTPLSDICLLSTCSGMFACHADGASASLAEGAQARKSLLSSTGERTAEDGVVVGATPTEGISSFERPRLWSVEPKAQGRHLPGRRRCSSTDRALAS